MTSNRKIIAVVPAAGIGSRMQADKPKQYLPIHGQPILQHTLNVLLSYPHISQIVLAVAADDPYIAQLNLTQNAGTDVWVMVHDAARPCLTHGDLDKLLEINDDNGAILAIPATDTIKRALPSQQIAHTEDRNQLWLAQTPQFFRAELLRNALIHAQQQQLAVTDEASAMELAGFRPHLVAGRSDNIKVTRPEDLALAEFYLMRKTT